MKADPRPPDVFRHEAMAARFMIAATPGATVGLSNHALLGEPAVASRRYLRQAADEAFAELDRLEARLSRYVESSDLSRINRLRRGDWTIVHPDTLACLRIAIEVQHATDGAFDVGYGSTAPADRPRLELDPDRSAVRVLAEGVRLDLGGIGKGFALDRMAALLREWDVDRAMLSAGESTVLALDRGPDRNGWPVSIGPEEHPVHLSLVGRAASGSGKAARGFHIIDPRTRRPATGRWRAWAVAPSAALADALSTAFMVMDEPAIRRYCRRHRAVAAYLLDAPSSRLVTVAPGEP